MLLLCSRTSFQLKISLFGTKEIFAMNLCFARMLCVGLRKYSFVKMRHYWCVLTQFGSWVLWLFIFLGHRRRYLRGIITLWGWLASKNEARTNVLLEKSSCELANLLFEVEDVIRIVVVGSSVTTLARTKPRLAFSSLTWYTSLISPLISQKYQESKYPRVK